VIRKRSTKGNTRKKIQRVTHERRYEGEDASKKDNENGKSEGLILERSGFKKKKDEELCDYVDNLK
jgi:hypothetical protein